ncbi:MAG TPA: crossover junction endodeoxyribonuclease RuvC [Candidatus Dormibacteraeota bacterium]|nr:crossover junction endodeoxyribonuclease RuvC [Candidatus Dormibacteraeota bacterium]
MLVLGVDPGLAITGWALVDGERGRLRLVQAGCWRTPAGADQGTRLLQLWDSLGGLLQAGGPASVAMERLFFSRNTSSAMAVSQARGVLVCAVAKAKLPLFEYTPAEVKQSVTGSGSAGKVQVARMVRLILGPTVPPGPDDLTDACAVGICHQHAAGLRGAVAGSSRR